MLKIKEVIVVEGKYDKIKLSQIVDTSIICTDGFQIYHNDDLIQLLRRLSAKCGVILFTDSDSAGFRIRSFIKNKLAGCNVKHAYIPDIYGKEKRKEKPSKQGLLGVEGVSDQVILQALTVCGATISEEKYQERKHVTAITKADLFRLGLSGRENSREKREKLFKKLHLPFHMSSNMLLDVLNTMLSGGMITEQDLIV